MGRIILRRPSSVPSVDPTSLDLDFFGRDFAGSPWVGTASAGASGTRSATEATNPPSVGASLLTGHAPAQFDGVNDQLALPGNATSYMTDSAVSGWFLFRASSAAAQDLDEPYLEPALMTDNGGGIGVIFDDAGFGFYRLTDSVGWKSVRATVPTGEVHIGTFRWDGASNTIQVGIDGPPNTSHFCLPFDLSLAVRTLSFGKNFNGTARFTGEVWDEAITRVLLTDNEFRGIVASANTRYGLTLSQASNVESGKFSGTTSPVRPYVGSTKTTVAAWEQGDGRKLTYKLGKYWLLGGWHASPLASWDNQQTTNEVWSSVDLVTWTKELTHLTGGSSSRWSQRHAFGTCDIGSYTYVIGGDQYVGGVPDVWRSTDMLTWTKVCDRAPWGDRVLLCAGAYDGDIHVIGGCPIEASVFYPARASHYVSSDGGATWTQLPDPPFATSAITQLFEHDGYLIVAGGNGGGVNTGRVYQNAVWAWNGSKWRQQTAAAPWSGRMWCNFVTYDDKIWMINGHNAADVDEGDAWYSRDLGQTWTEVSVPWPVSHADGVCATVADGIVVASGFGNNKSVFALKVAP